MAELQNTIDLLGDEIVAKSIVDRTITKFSDNLLSSVKQQSFRRCSALTRIDITNVTSIGQFAFAECSALTSADLGNLTSLESYTFNNCKALATVVIRKNTLCTLSNTNAFSKTPFASNGTGGTVYVPQALVTEYQNATNWSTLFASGKCNFVAIEGSEYE
jgi:hypothetical protein